MAERKKEDGGAKKCRRDKADSGYGARIKEAEKILAGEVNEDNADIIMENSGSMYGALGNGFNREVTAGQKLAKMVEERNLLIKQLENGLEEREKVVQELTAKLEKMPAGRSYGSTDDSCLSDDDAQKLLERTLKAENEMQRERAEAEKRIKEAKKAAGQIRKAKQQSDEIIRQAKQEVREILDEAGRKERAIREEAALMQERFNITDPKMQEIIDDINGRRPPQDMDLETETSGFDEMSEKEKKAYARAEKKSDKEQTPR